MVTSERVATLPTSSSGLEAHCPLIFLDSSEIDSAENLTELDEFLPVVGDTYILPKEQSDDYIDLPIINELGIQMFPIITKNLTLYSRERDRSNSHVGFLCS